MHFFYAYFFNRIPQSFYMGNICCFAVRNVSDVNACLLRNKFLNVENLMGFAGLFLLKVLLYRVSNLTFPSLHRDCTEMFLNKLFICLLYFGR